MDDMVEVEGGGCEVNWGWEGGGFGGGDQVV
jgi:hypothetical protein